MDSHSHPETCVKCNGGMTRGFILDNTYGGRLVNHWSQGEPQSSMWVGTKAPETNIPIAVFRCERCGYLEMYARDEFAAQ